MSTISAGTTSTTTLIATGDTTGSLVLKTNDTGSGGTTAMTIDTSQNVGIGTSSPAFKLDARGTSVFGDQANCGVYIQTPSATEGRISVGGRSSVISSNMTFYTSDGGANYERMRIDSAGRVTMPYQPSFLVTGTSYTQTSGGASKIIPSAESFDIGANYDLANGRFTAPVSGVYLFGFFGLSYPHAASDVCSLQYRKNGSGYGNNMQFGGNSANHQGVAGAITVSMSASDYVELFYTAAAGTSAKAYSSQWNMYGHLIG